PAIPFATMAISRDVIRRAAAQPDRPAVTGPCGPVSFGELAARGRARADELAARGVGPGQQVVTSDGDVVALLVDLLAADLLGAATVVTVARWPDSVRAAAVQAAASAAAPHGDDVCLVVFTSGSTGT